MLSQGYSWCSFSFAPNCGFLVELWNQMQGNTRVNVTLNLWFIASYPNAKMVVWNALR